MRVCTDASRKHQNLPLPGGAEAFTGDLTYYTPGLGACGVVSTNSDMIVSLSHFVYDKLTPGGNPNNNPLCGTKLRAKRVNELTGEMTSVDLTVVDRCKFC